MAREVLDALREVHRRLGPGLPEAAYDTCLSLELRRRGIPFVRQHFIRYEYKGELLDGGVTADFIIADKLLVELECVERLLLVHEQKVNTCLFFAGLESGLLVNFHEVALPKGIRHITESARRLRLNWQDPS